MSRSTSFSVYISQLIRFAHVPSHADNFNTRNKVLTANFSNKDIDIINFVQGLSEPEYYGDLVYKFNKKLVKIIFIIISKR